MAAGLFEEHREILKAAEEFHRAIARKPRIATAELSRQRVRLSTLVRKHRMEEEKHIFEPLRALGEIEGIAAIRHHIDDIRQAWADYSQHIRDWSPAAIDADWDGYVMAVLGRLSALRTLTVREEEGIYKPVLEALARRDAQPKAARG